MYNQFEIIQVLLRSPILQTSNWSGTFLLFLTANRLYVDMNAQLESQLFNGLY